MFEKGGKALGKDMKKGTRKKTGTSRKRREGGKMKRREKIKTHPIRVKI